MRLDVQTLTERLFQTLGITHRRGYQPVLGDVVVPVVAIPLQEEDKGAESAFNDAVTVAGEAFSKHASSAALAANYSYVQLFNPASSGVIVYVDRIHLVTAGAAAQDWLVNSHNVAITTDAGTGLNKDMGGAPSQAHLRTDQAAAILGTPFARTRRPANYADPLVFDPPLRLEAAEGIAIFQDVLNVACTAWFEWREKIAT